MLSSAGRGLVLVKGGFILVKGGLLLVKGVAQAKKKQKSVDQLCVSSPCMCVSQIMMIGNCAAVLQEPAMNFC